ncbi:MAG TPA: polyprenyl synthetase family protein [Steroidobacteraceae bacterium]|nr:polyprenyl synthetase family protein [Steroidobacteraceae bacterium]
MNSKRSALLALLPAIRMEITRIARATGWGDFEHQVERHLTLPRLPPHVFLPLACARATGGDPRAAIPVAVACGYLMLALRWFDDAQDRDRRQSLCGEIGAARATNMAAAALTLAWQALGEDRSQVPAVRESFGRHTVALARGQDRDLISGVPDSIEEYWTLMREKTGAALALACEMGAWAGGSCDDAGAAALARFGEHAGVLIQILDDLDGTFLPDGMGDLRAGKVTLPVLYGLAIEHEALDELADIVYSGGLRMSADRVREILDCFDTREFLVWAAFEERRQALALVTPPQSTESGIDAAHCGELRAYVDGLMVGWEALLADEKRKRSEGQVA